MSTERVVLPIRGLDCAGCVAGLEQVLRQEEGVIWAIVNFAASEVALVIDPAILNLAKLAQTVRGLGYELILATEQGSPLHTKLTGRRDRHDRGAWRPL
jgi:Cu+-exporting ATPase